MACGENTYFTGNGPVYLRRVEGDCGGPNEGWWAVGDANELTISTSQSFNDHYESLTGTRGRAARWLTESSVEFTLSVQNVALKTLAALTQGIQTGAVPGGSVADEVIPAWAGQAVFTQYPGISAVTVNDGDGITPLVEGTDYTLIDNGRDGGVMIISGAPNFVGPNIEVSYTHVGIEGSVKALTDAVGDYQIRFNGINLTATDKPVIVTMNRAQINAAEELSLIGTDMMNLTFTGAILPDENKEFWTWTNANAVA